MGGVEKLESWVWSVYLLLCWSCVQGYPIPRSSSYGLSTFKFDDLHLSEDETVLGSVRIFIDAGLLEAFKIDSKVCMCVHVCKKVRFTASVK